MDCIDSKTRIYVHGKMAVCAFIVLSLSFVVLSCCVVLCGDVCVTVLLLCCVWCVVEMMSHSFPKKIDRGSISKELLVLARARGWSDLLSRT